MWDRVLCETIPHEGNHGDGSLRISLPCHRRSACFRILRLARPVLSDAEGELVWQKDFGDMQTRNEFGEGSSLALHSDTIVVNWDHEGSRSSSRWTNHPANDDGSRSGRKHLLVHAPGHR